MRQQSTPEQHQGARATNLPGTRVDQKITKSAKVKRRRSKELDKIHENINSIKKCEYLIKVNMVRACREKNLRTVLQEEPSCHIRDTFSLKNLDETINIANCGNSKKKRCSSD